MRNVVMCPSTSRTISPVSLVAVESIDISILGGEPVLSLLGGGNFKFSLSSWGPGSPVFSVPFPYSFSKCCNQWELTIWNLLWNKFFRFSELWSYLRAGMGCILGFICRRWGFWWTVCLQRVEELEILLVENILGERVQGKPRRRIGRYCRGSRTLTESDNFFFWRHRLKSLNNLKEDLFSLALFFFPCFLIPGKVSRPLYI